jgi:hypothetical protein
MFQKAAAGEFVFFAETRTIVEWVLNKCRDSLNKCRDTLDYRACFRIGQIIQTDLLPAAPRVGKGASLANMTQCRKSSKGSFSLL